MLLMMVQIYLQLKYCRFNEYFFVLSGGGGLGKCPPGGNPNVTIKNWKLLRKKSRSAPGYITVFITYYRIDAVSFVIHGP